MVNTHIMSTSFPISFSPIFIHPAPSSSLAHDFIAIAVVPGAY